MFEINYNPNPETHKPHGISSKLFNCKVCGAHRNPGKNFGNWPCSKELPCPCCLREHLDDIFRVEF